MKCMIHDCIYTYIPYIYLFISNNLNIYIYTYIHTYIHITWFSILGDFFVGYNFVARLQSLTSKRWIRFHGWPDLSLLLWLCLKMDAPNSGGFSSSHVSIICKGNVCGRTRWQAFVGQSPAFQKSVLSPRMEGIPRSWEKQKKIGGPQTVGEKQPGEDGFTALPCVQPQGQTRMRHGKTNHSILEYPVSDKPTSLLGVLDRLHVLHVFFQKCQILKRNRIAIWVCLKIGYLSLLKWPFTISILNLYW